MIKTTPSPELHNLVTFIPNKREPIHNWYYYKEGYSRGLVEHFIKKWNMKKNQTVLDPFCGVGTTLLTCKQNNIPSFGVDVSPLTVLVSQVKTTNYDLQELEQQISDALDWKFSIPKTLPSDKFFKRAMSTRSLQDIIFYRKKVSQIGDRKIQNFLLLALMDSAFRGSYLRKDGSVIKIKKEPKPPVGKLFKYKVRRMLKELKKANLSSVETTAKVGDARNLQLEDNSIDYVITSPPYLNKIEYSKIYKFEYSLFLDPPKSKISGFTGKWEAPEDTTEKYFDELHRVLEQLKRVCKPGARLSITIGGGCFPSKAVLVDEQLAELASQVGFNITDILVARNSWCTRRRTEKVGQIRESVVCMENL
jgi:DNA modification methylase